MEKFVKDLVKNKKTCYFISPHLDDAAFSAGGLISYLAGKTRVIVVTVFTRAGRDEHSLSALAYARKCGYKEVEISKFFKERRKEDKKLFDKLGVEGVHLGFIDALWRKKVRKNFFEKLLSVFLNDIRYIYPTHRFHIAKGKISQNDMGNFKKLKRNLEKLVKEDKDVFIFCPVGIGNHVDHILVREACTQVFDKVVYWVDSPYNLYFDSNVVFINKNRLKKIVFRNNQRERRKMFFAYKTQIGKLFADRKDFAIPLETYYLDKTRVFKKNTRVVRKPSVTVGIPAYDEEGNIGRLLKVLLRQRQDNFDLKEIIVVSDGSKDKTKQIIESFEDSRIRLFVNKHRLGQNESQNLIVSKTESEYLLLLEADVLPASNSYIFKLVTFAKNKSVDVVQGLPKALSPTTFVESVLVKQGLSFSEYFLKGKINPFLHVSGQGGRLISKRVYKQLSWPDDVSEDLYLLYYCHRKGFRYDLSTDTRCFCRYPGNIKDFIKKRKKVVAGTDSLSRYFSMDSLRVFKPVTIKDSVAIFIKFLLNDQVRFFAYLFIKMYVEYKIRGNSDTKTYYYAESTKYLEKTI